jgi:hypothetical protein
MANGRKPFLSVPRLGAGSGIVVSRLLANDANEVDAERSKPWNAGPNTRANALDMDGDALLVTHS